MVSFDDNRKLPFIKDIINIAVAHSSADYVVYTNADIILQPYFYAYLHRQLTLGIDALTINRRRLPATFHDINQLPDLCKAPADRTRV
jgi:hypothetical protein